MMQIRPLLDIQNINRDSEGYNYHQSYTLLCKTVIFKPQFKKMNSKYLCLTLIPTCEAGSTVFHRKPINPIPVPIPINPDTDKPGNRNGP